MSTKIKEVIKKTYTEALGSSSCGCGPSCCGPEANIGESYSNIKGYNPEADFGLGCGLPTQHAKIKTGDTVLDLGSGAGNDIFVARNIVGEKGQLIGIDMTEAMIEKANENKRKLKFDNIKFELGEIENLPVQNDLVDVAISNCVMNLVPDKLKAYQEVYRVLKNDGHFSISDIVLNGHLPEKLMNSAEMYAGCISGALDKSTYIETIKEAGFKNINVVQEREVVLPDELLLKHLSQDEFDDYKKSKSAVLSITVYAEK